MPVQTQTVILFSTAPHILLKILFLHISNCLNQYFEILEDTFLGFHLYPYTKSIRKRQIKSPKFYFFDLGVARALSGLLTETITPSNYAFGDALEHLVVSEAYRINEYFEGGYKFSYFRSKDGVEIDLVLERGKEVILVEIKSKNKVLSHDLKNL